MPDEGGPDSGQYASHEARFVQKILGDENSLNDVLNVVMALMPDGFQQRLADQVAPGAIDVSSTVDVTHGYRERYGWDAISASDVTQPDHLHAGPQGSMAIELKVRSLAGDEQLLHYALLASQEDRREKLEGNHLTILLTPRKDLAGATKSKHASGSVAGSTMIEKIPDYLKSQLRLKHVSAEELEHAVLMTRIVHVSFQEFVGLLRRDAEGSTGPGASTLTKLVDGAEAEFRRHAITAGAPFQ